MLIMKGFITLSKLKDAFCIFSGKNQIVIDLKSHPNGLYLISLNSRNQVIDTKKLSKGGH